MRDLPEGYGRASDLPIRYGLPGCDRQALLRKGSRPGTYNVWPVERGPALETGILDIMAAKRWPEHADTILGRPDTSG